MSALHVYLPAYNEAANIRALLSAWEAAAPELASIGTDLRIHVIDDHSFDGTGEIARCAAHSMRTPVEVIRHPRNLGLHGGLNTALNHFALNAGPGDRMALMDADNTHDPAYAPRMLRLMQFDGLDCVIASRYQDGAEVVGLARHRELLSDLARVYYRTALSIPGVEDYTCGYRIYTYEIISKLRVKFGERMVRETSFACMMELLFKLHRIGARFGEVAFVLRYDQRGGQSKMRVVKTTVRSIVTGLRLRLSRDEAEAA